MNIIGQLWQAWKTRNGHSEIPVAEWFPGHDGRLYQMQYRETASTPRLFVCKEDGENGFGHRLYTMDATGKQPRMEIWGRE